MNEYPCRYCHRSFHNPLWRDSHEFRVHFDGEKEPVPAVNLFYFGLLGGQILAGAVVSVGNQDPVWMAVFLPAAFVVIWYGYRLRESGAIAVGDRDE